MQSYSLFAPAKINLHLEIIGHRPDGYHELVMIMQSVNLGDVIHLRANGKDEIRLFCQNPEVPLNNTNLAYKAAHLMQQQFPKLAQNFGGFDIVIEKNIPVAAGLAGGSTNAAAVLVGINLMWSLGLTQPELRDLGALLGSDVPFCISGGTAIATGRGEQIEPLPDLSDIWVILAKYSNLSVSTPWAYNSYREQFNHLYISDSQGINQRTRQVHSGDLVKAISQRNSEQIGALLYNDLEKVVLPEFPTVKALIDAFKAENVLGSMMSGSGPTVFALCDNQNQAEAIANKVQKTINDSNLHCWVAQMCTHGIIKQ
ncbi:MAG: 4-(cytidine 5'-diphospho)-2-C-methyl-D-erythritol kinase [Cyanobacteria bacterium]|nr:4-(cytidine 5'-diphospho)-2-C-methyl-D-erythritol kinase [Cyanobacteria bacterium CG_2015-16_32_12]NCO77325.1 4-(cytidine 5'-diphospho)-2-C-methyl-D-erythritol kinase [Cyanobacteria bacterium CG_2015-22_32_23]NCQ05488.1 4-(cytidine 5'-diphospho)-2-C-methyl-D-erythritol kinase [Cyanobacteria bacterium CG_2015-09_32_10]NCQ42207.1 4-(cytidine 5'-diphospho)-2-C-methyl-D-erythritol kinase [Cyanobacteria bacterium CG_2015-04_32_10]NCS84172.1 4-(cytidine 5'-diphospho)-2-C-methyl-D-erythritol kinase